MVEEIQYFCKGDAVYAVITEQHAVAVAWEPRPTAVSGRSGLLGSTLRDWHALAYRVQHSILCLCSVALLAFVLPVRAQNCGVTCLPNVFALKVASEAVNNVRACVERTAHHSEGETILYLSRFLDDKYLNINI